MAQAAEAESPSAATTFYRELAAALLAAPPAPAGAGGPESVGAGELPPAGDPAFLAELFARAERFAASWQALDGPGRAIYRNALLARALGARHGPPGGPDPATHAARLAELEAAAHGASDLEVAPVHGWPLTHFPAIPFAGGTWALESWPDFLRDVVAGGQYFLDRPEFRVRPEPGEVVLDGGGCFGDTAVLFAAAVGESGRVLTCEPLPSYQRVIARNIAQNDLKDRIDAVPYALGSEPAGCAPGALALDDGGGHPGFRTTGREAELPVTSVDALRAERGLDRLDFIKLDIEGAELAALEGAAATIQRCRPKLAVAIYHNAHDLAAIPAWLHARWPEYRLTLAHYTAGLFDTVLYARPA